jgi:hypothetical protein
MPCDAGTPDGGDPTLLATGLTFPQSVLNVYGGWAYWYENANGQTATSPARLRAIPVTGGCGEPVTIDSVSADAGVTPLPTSIAYDGTDVYWTHGTSASGGPGFSVVKAAPGSTSMTPVATSSTQYVGNAFVDDMVFAGGNLYLQGNGSGFLQIAPSSGTITPLAPPAGIDTTTLWTTDGNHLFFEDYLNSGASTFYAAPLSFTSATALVTTPTTNFSAGMAVSNGNAYVISYSQSNNPQTSQLNVAPTAGPDAGSEGVAALQNFNAQAIVGDASGVFLANAQGGNSTYPMGIYSVSTMGMLTMVHSISGGFGGLALDATNVYWIDGAGLHKFAR